MGDGGGGMSFSTSFTDIGNFGNQLFGDKQRQNVDGTSTTAGSQKEKLTLSEDAINAIIKDVLGGADGLASIFSGEQNAGIFNSSVAAQAAGDLASKLVGEIAKLTAERETTQTGTTKQSQQTKSKDAGILENVVGGIGSVFKDIGNVF